MASTIGINLRVTGHCNQGGRKYMEDAFVVAYQQTEDEKDLEYAYFGIFDGHGGREAAQFAKQHLMDNIVSQKIFWSDDDQLVLRAIREGFLATHLAMWKEVSKWPKTMSGLPSTSGTTSSIAFIRRGKMYIGHVGDSKIILGTQDPGRFDVISGSKLQSNNPVPKVVEKSDKSTTWQAKPLTKDHKPESPAERQRIYQAGGCVMNKAGVERVVWYRPRIGHQGPIRRSTRVDHIPFLAVARSLGDLWSYNYSEGAFVVSPDPDVSVITLDPKKDRCIILASDGLWNMLSPRDAVNIVQETEMANEKLILEADQSSINKPASNPSKLLVDRALELWYGFKMRADNTSVVTVLLDPPGPPKREVLLRQRVMQKLRPREDPLEDTTDSEEDTAKIVRKTNIYSPNINNNNKVDDAQIKDNVKKPPQTSRFIHSPQQQQHHQQYYDNRNQILPKPVVLTPKRIVLTRTSPKKPVPMADINDNNNQTGVSGRPPDNNPNPASKTPESPFKSCKETNCNHFKCHTLRKVIGLSPSIPAAQDKTAALQTNQSQQPVLAQIKTDKSATEKSPQIPPASGKSLQIPPAGKSPQIPPTGKSPQIPPTGKSPQIPPAGNNNNNENEGKSNNHSPKVLRSSQKDANTDKESSATSPQQQQQAALSSNSSSSKRKWTDDERTTPVKTLKAHHWSDVSSCRAAVTRSLCTRSRMRTGKIKD